MASSPLFYLTRSMSAILVFALLLLEGTGNTMVAAAGQGQCTPACIIPVCKTVGGTFFDVQFCEGALGSDGRSANAGMDYRAYAVIAADLLAANATKTAAKIDGLLRAAAGSRDDATTTRSLRSCQALYSGIVQRQASCKSAITGKRDAEAVSSLEKSASAANECEDGFGKSSVSVASPLTAEDKNAFRLAKLTVALING
ncbi:hypothetical protein EJB05_51881, partial [Eragrostis curvula]